MVYTWLKPTTQDANMPPPDQPTPSEKKSLSDLFAFAQNRMNLGSVMGRTELAYANDWVINTDEKNSLYDKYDNDNVNVETNKARCAKRVNNLIVALQGIVDDSDKPTLDEIARQIIDPVGGVNGEPKLLVEITPKDRLIGLNNLLTMMLSADKREDARTRYQNQYKEVWNEEDLLPTKGVPNGNKVIEKYDPAWDQVAGLTEDGLVGQEGRITQMIGLLNEHCGGWDTDEDNKKLYLKIILKSKAMGWELSEVPVPEAWQAEVDSLTGAFGDELTQGSQTEATPEQQIQLCEQVLSSLKQKAPDYVTSKIQDASATLEEIESKVKTGQQVSPKDILTLQEQTSIAVYNTLNRNKEVIIDFSFLCSHRQNMSSGNGNSSESLDAHNNDLKKFSEAQATLGVETPEDSMLSIVMGQSREVIDYNKKLSDHNKDLHDYLRSQQERLKSLPDLKMSEKLDTSSRNRRLSLGEMAERDFVYLQKNNLNNKVRGKSM